MSNLTHHTLIGEFYLDHHGWLQGWLRKKLGCSAAAADVAHDTFLRLLLGGDVSYIREPRAFLTTTASRLVIDHQRRHKLEQAYLQALGLLQEDAHAPSPEAHRQAIETLVALAAMLEKLPHKARQAFLLNRLEEMSHAEIAERLGVSVSMVKQYLAKAMLQCYLAVYGSAPDYP